MKKKFVKLISGLLLSVSFMTISVKASEINQCLKSDINGVAIDDNIQARAAAESISSLTITGYGWDAYGAGDGWKGSYVGDINRADLKDLWINTYQTGYGKIDYVKIDGKNVAYDYDKFAEEQYGEVKHWYHSIVIKDNGFVKNLSTGKHTFEVRISSTNTTPYRSLVAKATFNIPD